MGRKSGAFFIVILLILLPTKYTSANTANSDPVFTEISGRILCVECIDDTDKCYIGTEKGLYETVDRGNTWKRMELPPGVFKIADIEIIQKGVYMLASDRVYISGHNDGWRWIPGRTDVRGLVTFSEKGEDNIVFAWNEKEIFWIKEDTWEYMGPGILTDTLSDVACCGGVIFAASGNRVFYSPDVGRTWNKISLLADEEGDEIRDDAADTAGEKFSLIKNIDPFAPEEVALATANGVFVIKCSDFSVKRIDTTGLPSARVIYTAYSGGKIFTATDKKVFYLDEESCWQNFFEKISPGPVLFLKSQRGSEGRGWLWIAGEKEVYRKDIDLSMDPCKREVISKKCLIRLNREPSIREVHKMAIDYAEVSPRKIKGWRTGARWRALLPRLSLRFAESRDDNIEVYTSSSKSYVFEGPREIDSDWSVDLTWDLADLVWSNYQTTIDVRSKLMVQLRDEILEEVTRLYFERKKILMEIDELEKKNDPGDLPEVIRSKVLAKKLKITELTAYIDALTGGKFSEAMR